MRNEATKTTIYEIKIPSTVFRGEHLLTSGQATTTSAGQVNYLHAGMQFGVAVCVNDGDNDAGETGQQGWSGWGPYAIVYGNNPESAGLVTLVRSKGGTGYTPSGGGHRLLEDDAFSRH